MATSTNRFHDPFRPHMLPARLLYDTFQDEAALRPKRELSVWIEREPVAVWEAACAYAKDNGFYEPTLEEVKQAERYARGSVDYGLKWALQVQQLIMKDASRPFVRDF
jgi:hypothetical protein